MIHPAKNRLICLVLIAAFAFGGPAWAQDIKARMHSRLPAIAALKAKGIVGENAQGYLAYVKGQGPQKELVAAENQDRRTVYQAIARKQGTTADLVGQRRALQLAERAQSGEWLQNADGQWYQK